jgi:hypothetical protein
MEQISNGRTLQQLGYGRYMNQLDSSVLEQWLHNTEAVQVIFPNVAKLIVQWIQDGMPKMDEDFIQAIWDSVKVER